MTVDVDTGRALHAALTGELAWLDAGGRPDARPVTPLLLDDHPAVAFPYADQAVARQVAAAPVAAVVLSDQRMSGSGWRPLVVLGRPRLTEDRDGETFRDLLLEQELRKHPPSRALIDSPLLRREHWWYLPRLIITLEVRAVTPVGVRPDVADQVLAVAGGAGGLFVDTVRCAEDGHDRIRVGSLAGRPLEVGPAVLLGHDFSKDLESWTPWTTRGLLDGEVLTVQQRPARTTVEPRPGLWARLRRQGRLERACRRAMDGPAPHSAEGGIGATGTVGG